MRILLIILLCFLTSCASKQLVARFPYNGFHSKESRNDPRDFYLLSYPEHLFPFRYMEKGIEGHVVLKYDISKNGYVESVEVIESTATSEIEKISTNYIESLVYKPRMVNGIPEKVEGIQVIHKYCYKKCSENIELCEHPDPICR